MPTKTLKPRPEDRADAARQTILRHAEELFGHYGYAKTNIGDIAGRCDMSPGNLYRYFENKKAIGLAVCDAYFRMAEAGMQTALMTAEGGAEARIRAFIAEGVANLVREMRQNPKLVELAEIVCEGTEDGELVVSQELSDHFDWRVARLTEEVEKGAAAGELALLGDGERTARALMAATKGFWVPFMLAKIDLDTVPQKLDDVLELTFRGLRA